MNNLQTPTEIRIRESFADTRKTPGAPEWKKNLYSTLIGEIELDKSRPRTAQQGAYGDIDIINRVKSFVKSATTIAELEKVSEADLQKARLEIEELSQYLPKQLSGTDLENAIRSFVAENPDGKPHIKTLFPYLNGLGVDYDKKAASDIFNKI